VALATGFGALMTAGARYVRMIILAAGRSTRFGRPKQSEPVGPNGETILDITLRDAFAAGGQSAHVVTSPALADHFRQHYRADPRVDIHVQQEPLGTAHATMIGMDDARCTNIVANGDDLYGVSSLRTAVAYAHHGDEQESAIIAYDLGRTLSPNGPVNRAICQVQGNHLADTHEVPGFRADTQGRIQDALLNAHGSGTPVSMNLWVFRPAFNNLLRDAWRARAEADRSEFGLPDAVRHAIVQGHMFRMLRSPSAWFGLTFPQDAQLVRDHLRSPDVT
jgi:MobA-like NTP transferase domain